jgi:hypothetical protein
MKRPAVGLAVLGVVLAGCGSGGGSAPLSGDKPAAPQTSPGPGASVDPLRPQTPDPRLVAASPRPLPTATPPSDTKHELISVPWRLVGLDSAHRTLTISYEGGGCQTPAGVRVTQATDYVMVGAYDVIMKPTRTPVACAAYAIVVTGTVTLDEPLGKRRLYHAPTS